MGAVVDVVRYIVAAVVVGLFLYTGVALFVPTLL